MLPTPADAEQKVAQDKIQVESVATVSADELIGAYLQYMREHGTPPGVMDSFLKIAAAVMSQLQASAAASEMVAPAAARRAVSGKEWLDALLKNMEKHGVPKEDMAAVQKIANEELARLQAAASTAASVMAEPATVPIPEVTSNSGLETPTTGATGLESSSEPTKPIDAPLVWSSNAPSATASTNTPSTSVATDPTPLTSTNDDQQNITKIQP